MYHRVTQHQHGAHIDTETFERHIRFLKQHFRVVPPLDANREGQIGRRIPVALTFDDGFRNNAEAVAPILRKHGVPALFFVSSRHSTPGRYLWFSYLEALRAHFRHRSFRFRGDLIDMTRGARAQSVTRLRSFLHALRPYPGAMYRAIDEELPRLEDFVDAETLRDRYEGMTAEQLSELFKNPLFAAGVHTVDHPFLTLCTRDEVAAQIQENKAWLERCCGRECRSIAYPLGDYDLSTIDVCRQVGLTDGFAVHPSLGVERQLERSRLGVYHRSLPRLAAKAALGSALRMARSVTANTRTS